MANASTLTAGIRILVAAEALISDRRPRKAARSDPGGPPSVSAERASEAPLALASPGKTQPASSSWMLWKHRLVLGRGLKGGLLVAAASFEESGPRGSRLTRKCI